MSVVSDEAEPDDVVKHFWTGGGHGQYMEDIRSYADLQRFSSSQWNAIGREKPVLHIKEQIPISIQPLSGEYAPTYLEIPPRSSYHEDDIGYTAIESYVNATLSYTIARDTWSWSSTWWKAQGSCMFVLHSKDGCWIAIYQSLPGITTRATPGDEGLWPSFRATSLDNFHTLFNLLKGSLPPSGVLSEDQLKAWVNTTGRALGFYVNWTKYERGMWHQISSSYPLLSQYVDESDLFDPYYDSIPLMDQHTAPVGLRTQLCTEALAATSFNSNSIANALDLFDLASDILSGDIFGVFKDARRAKDLIRDTKSISSDLWLQYRYVYCTTKSDLEELKRYVGEGDPTVARAGRSCSEGLMHVKIMMQPKSSSLGKTVNSLTSIGLAPNAYNMWDLVPFSFVVDWFVDVGGLLESITQYGRCAAYDIQSVTTSWKWQDDLEKGHTKAHMTYYKRDVSPTVPPYIPYLEQRSASGETITKRFIDSVALVG
jgi:hypothetical protein